MPKISIIIPVRTITNYLRESLPFLLDLDYKNYEVLIFTDEKETLECESSKIKVIPSGKVGPAEKRNLALKYATGEILAFLDDDAYPTKNWLTNAQKAFSSEYCGVGGPSITPPNENFMATVSGDVLSSFLTSGGTVHRHTPQNARVVDDYPTVNLFVMKKDFESVGGFSPEFWPGEDTKLCLDLINQTGKKIFYSPDVLVYHHRRELFTPHLKQISRYGMHRGQFARIFPETSRKLQYFIPSVFVCGLALGFLFSLLFPLVFVAYTASLAFYFSILIIEGSKVLWKRRSLLFLIYFVIGVFLTHVVYGVNFIYGLFVRPKLNLRSVDKKTNKYLGG